MHHATEAISHIFSFHSIQIEGVNTRVAQVTCDRCLTTATVRNNTQSRAAGYDDDIVEKRMVTKFEKLGWKIAKHPSGHRCPACFTAIKIAAIKRKKEKAMTEHTVVPLTPTPPRTPSRDEKRIIFLKIDENYLGESVGYASDWSDERIATDLNVPVAWVAAIREENFGPNINEATTKAESDFAAFMTELTAVRETMAALDIKAEQFAKELQKLRRTPQ